MKKYINIFVFLCALILTFNYAYSFNKNVTILVKGKVVDQFTGEPVETTVEFKTSKGKKFRIKTNSLDGTFEQIFNAGDNIEIKFYFWNVARTYYKIHIKDTIAYSEQYENFTVKKLEVGKSLFKFNLFKPRSSEFVSNYKQLLDSVEHLLRFARNIKVEFRVNAHDSYAQIKKYIQPEKPKKKKRHKKKKYEEPKPQMILQKPDNQAITSLVNARVGKLEAFVPTWKRHKKKITVKGDFSTLQENEGSYLDGNYDFEVIVTAVKKTFK